uniref:Tbk1/Ikki binding domain-containing protein n=2 Tax=Pyxicephalus adspersus TaxID=30357 RepID=A0AAV2ZYF8_PYXAD|nr:TPA: hypothetical protein GDO54_015551 [Pyxicephalus adspersus]
MSPKLENKDGWKNDSASLEQLQQQLRVITQREKHYKEQLDLEKLRYMEMEGERDKLISTLSIQNEEIQCLKTLLKEANERQDSRTCHGHEAEMRNKNVIPDLPAASAFSENDRQSIERVFSGIKEQFSQICKLTKKQSSLLNTVHMKREDASGKDPLEQFSMPIQCTDEDIQEAKMQQKPITIMGPPQFAPITPQGLTPEDDLAISVESLSNLSVKFPPSTDNSEFLQSSAEKLPNLTLALEQNTNSSKIQGETPLRKFSTAISSPPYSPRSPRTVCHMVNNELEPNYKDTFVEGAEDSSLFFAANNLAGKGTNAFRVPDIPNLDDSIDMTERTVRGPQQPVWKPSSHQDDDPSIAVGEKWDQDSSDVCEFCQAVFPSSARAEAEFLRHLNSHFNNLT